MKRPHLLPVLLLLLTCLVGYRDVLRLGWPGQDSITAVESSRFTDLSGLVRLCTRPLMHGTGFIFRYWRPATAISFGLNHLLAGTRAWGYHAVDLLILLGICLCIYGTGVVMPRRGMPPRYVRWSAFAAAFLFANHAVNLTVLPVVARRSEGQLVLFGVAALFCAAAAPGRRAGGRVFLYLGALLCLALSTLSKEAGLLFFPSVLLLSAAGLRGKRRGRNLAVLAAAAVAAGGLALALMVGRRTVTGIPASYNIHFLPEGIRKTTWEFLLAPPYPVRFLGTGTVLGGRLLPVLLSAAGVLLLGGVLLHVLLRGARPRLRKGAFVLAAAVGVLFLAGLLRACLSAAVPRGGAPDAAWSASALSTGWWLVFGCGALALLTFAAALRRILARDEGLKPGDMVTALSAWIFCAWIIVCLTGLYTPRNSQGPTVAYLLLLLLGLDAAIEALRPAAVPLRRIVPVTALLLLAIQAATLVGFGHPLRRYREWTDLDRIATAYLEGVLHAAKEDGLEGVRAIELEGAPGMCFFLDRYPKCTALARYVDYTLRSWFRWRLPAAPPVVRVTLRRLRDPAAKVHLARRREGEKLIITAEYR